MSDYPVIEQPQWRENDINPNQAKGYDAVSGKLVIEPEGAIALLRQADEIVYAAEPDHRDVLAFDQLIYQVFGYPGRVQIFQVLHINSLASDALRGIFESPVDTRHPDYCAALQQGQARKWFEYNFNVNAQAVLGRELAAVGVVHAHRQVLSRYALQMFYDISRCGPLREAEVLKHASCWVGTGKYPPDMLGSYSSIALMFENLEAAGLVDRLESSRSIRLSLRGEALLTRLHPGCEDIDLPGRLTHWANTWPASEPAMTRYLKTFFGRQLHYLPPLSS